MYGESTSQEEEFVGKAVVDAAYRVHSRLGPGLLESVYQVCMAYELRQRGFEVARHVPVPVMYEQVKLDEGNQLDLLVNDLVIVETKSVEKSHPVHPMQVRTFSSS